MHHYSSSLDDGSHNKQTKHIIRDEVTNPYAMKSINVVQHMVGKTT